MSYNLVLKATTNFADQVMNNGYIDQLMYNNFVNMIFFILPLIFSYLVVIKTICARKEDV